MVGDPEDFLDQHEPAAAIAFRLRVIDRDFGAVVHRHPNHLTHGYQSLSRLPRACRRAVLPSPFWRKDCPSTSSEPAPAKARWERGRAGGVNPPSPPCIAAKSRSEEHTSELQSLMRISYPVFVQQYKHVYFLHLIR